MFECVINISEGRDEHLLVLLEQAAGPSFRDRHSDGVHHRSVFTLINTADQLVSDVQALIQEALRRLDLTDHKGVHPRLGVVDVVPFVPLGVHTLDEAVALRDAMGEWVARTQHVPVFFYGPVEGVDRSLPFVRKHAFGDLSPDCGPRIASARSGAITIGARPVLVAWNIWMAHTSLQRTLSLAAALRQPGLRTLGLPVGNATQVSCNVIDVNLISLTEVYDQLTELLVDGETIVRCEIVGLAPQAMLARVAPSRWGQVGLHPDATIEAKVGPQLA